MRVWGACVFEDGGLREALAEGETAACADCERVLFWGPEFWRMEQCGLVRVC